VVVDYHAMVAEGLSSLLEAEKDLSVVGTATDAEHALLVVSEMRPDVVLVDYRLPDGDGASVTAEILRRWPDTKVVMLTAARGDEVLARAIEAGCSGFLPKERGGSEVVSAVRAAYRGESLIPTATLAGLISRMRRPPERGANDLTVRELEVLDLLAKGESTEQLRVALYLSAHTVRNHVRNILVKLGAHSKLEAVAIASRQGIVSLSEPAQ
jgi:DNA-binding NarL/FixJ family response regulator